MSNFKTKLHKIKAFAFDVDGVFTDGTVLATDNGDLLRSHNAKDGFALRFALQKGYKIAIITGGASKSILHRFKPIGITDIYLKSHNKLPDFIDFLDKYQLSASEVLYMGDDLPDIEILSQCGVASCPSDAVDEVKDMCHYISHFPGGKGCVRDVIEQTMKVQNNWGFDTVTYSG